MQTGTIGRKQCAQQKEDIGQILRSISDLVPMNVFSTHNVDQALDEADHERNRMIHDVQGLDRELTTEYRQVTEDVPAIAALYGELIQATRQGADIQPMHFNARAYHDSKIYQLQGELEKATQSYLDDKKQQEKAWKEDKMKGAETSLPPDIKLELLKNKIINGIDQGLIEVGKDTIGGIIEGIRHPVQTLTETAYALSNWDQTSAMIAHAIADSYERDMVHGDAYSRSRWVTYALAMVATSVVGTKGIDKVGKAADLRKLGDRAGQIRTLKTTITKHVDNTAIKINEWNNPFVPKLQFDVSYSNLPYNTFDTGKFRSTLIKIAGKFPEGSNQRKTIESQSYMKYIDRLKNTNNFRSDALEHILVGQLNARGKAVGYHSDVLPNTPGKIILGTESIQNKYGIYKAKVKVNGVTKTANGGQSTFFPNNWNAQRVVDSINEAYRNKEFMVGTKNIFVGETSKGVKIQMYIDINTGKIISAFPIY